MNDFIEVKHINGHQLIRVSTITGVATDGNKTRIWTGEWAFSETSESYEEIKAKIKQAPK
jgi:hypothetical protein